MNRRLLAASLLAAYVVALPGVAQARDDGRCHGLLVTISGTAGDDHVVGTDGPDVIRGYAGDDTIEGLGGDDVLCGNRGHDVIDGGEGDDWLGGGHRSDDLTGGPGNDTVQGGTSLDRIFADEGDDTYLLNPVHVDRVIYRDAPGPIHADLGQGVVTGWGTDRLQGSGNPGVYGFFVALVGSSYDDRIIGGPNNDLVYGGRGDDVIRGGPGYDHLVPQGGHNLTYGGEGADNFFLSARRPHMKAADVVRGGPGNDGVSGLNVHDQVHLGPGGDYIDGVTTFAKDQVVDAGGDNPYDDLRVQVLPRADGSRWDRVTFDLGRGQMSAGHRTVPMRGIDGVSVYTPLSVAEEELILGSSRADRIMTGGSHPHDNPHVPVTVRAGAGDDEITTGAEHDRVFGGPGRDYLQDGGGQDSCWSVEEAGGCEHQHP